MQRMCTQVSQLANKFRGTLIGALLGDCLGAPFEGDFVVTKSVLTNYVTKLQVETGSVLQMYSYTDDTAMTKSVAESLLECKGFDAKDMAKRFTFEYEQQPKRGYGANVVDVFSALKLTDFEDPFAPAKAQFKGLGSYGNGSAMRISPVALFGYNMPFDQLCDLTKNCSLLTHTNRGGYNGAILQCLAIHQALHTNITDINEAAKFNSKEFLNSLIDSMTKVEKDETSQPFTDKLLSMKKVIEEEKELGALDIAYLFGHGVAAINSVPTAIYIFLRAQKPLQEYETDNVFVRTLYLSISVGGDTDTIASMACSLTGALYGATEIPEILIKRCEVNEEIMKLADNLYAAVMGK
ncbi:Poly(ADP-ribose) glycohydrolase ARH3-like protein [Dinothrombium tinctorium]|uniref:ADP-ribosylhydrolase ARH3 n=1 Tax=Dinothrombium tinctorium TaxID=1965070 RepID=A0A3S3RJT3_9ACAR|nr:Poly(ADP-ribose) glycohydrolase ARH3-like protein [Dinothrombium tinctorium]